MTSTAATPTSGRETDMPYVDENGNTVYTEDDIQAAAQLGAQNALAYQQPVTPSYQQAEAVTADSLNGTMLHLSEQINQQNERTNNAAAAAATDKAMETLQ